MAFFDKFKGGSGGGDKSGNGSGKGSGGHSGGDGFKRDLRKANKFYEHAEATADAGNYDYSIECYISGFRFDPDNLPKHEALHEVAKRRKVKGGKKAGMMEAMKSGGSHSLDKMLHAEKLWAMDLLNVKHMVDAMKHAVDANTKEDEINMGEVAYWIGSNALDYHAQSGKIKKGDPHLRDLRDYFAAIGAWDKAVEACKYLVRLDPENSNLIKELKDLEAENTMQQGGYSSEARAEEGGFRNFVRDAEQQKALEQDDQIRQHGSQKDELIARRRAEVEEDPEDQDKLLKLIDALVAKESDESEKEAIELLRKIWEESGTYRYKLRMGDISMKQINRHMRDFKAKLEANPDDTDLKAKYTDARKKQLAFELKEYEERVKNYPTDMALRYELGRRLYLAGMIDDAIGAFQQAKQDPKLRAQSHRLLGECYLRKEWLDEAIDTLEEGVKAHKIPDDRMALDLLYLHMTAYAKSARKTGNVEHAQKARDIASKILQTNINYRDIKKKVDELKSLVDELSQK